MDYIHVTGIRCYGYTGALPEEQVLGQWFEIDLSLGRDLSLPGHSDRLEDTLDYCRIIATVERIVTGNKYQLIECLATKIVEAILQTEQVEQVRIHLTKVSAPIPGFSGRVSIELTRNRSQSCSDLCP